MTERQMFCQTGVELSPKSFGVLPKVPVPTTLT